MLLCTYMHTRKYLMLLKPPKSGSKVTYCGLPSERAFRAAAPQGLSYALFFRGAVSGGLDSDEFVNARLWRSLVRTPQTGYFALPKKCLHFSSWLVEHCSSSPLLRVLLLFTSDIIF